MFLLRNDSRGSGGVKVIEVVVKVKYCVNEVQSECQCLKKLSVLSLGTTLDVRV